MDNFPPKKLFYPKRTMGPQGITVGTTGQNLAVYMAFQGVYFLRSSNKGHLLPYSTSKNKVACTTLQAPNKGEREKEKD